MTQLERAVESTGALVLARFVMPAIMGIGITGFGWWMSNMYDELRAQRLDNRNMMIEIREIRTLSNEHERRLNRMDNPRASPGAYVRPDQFKATK